MKKKNIVFVLPSLDAGGAEKSLVNLLNVFDFNKYNVDLILLSKTGLFLDLIPPMVNLREIGGHYPEFSRPLLRSIFLFCKKLNILLIYHRFLFTLKNYFIKNTAIAEQRAWSNLKQAIPQVAKDYDVAIGFLEKSSIYFVIDRVSAKNKIGFIHNDYNKLGLNPTLDYSFFNELNSIVTVSNECASVLKNVFPGFAGKVAVVKNVVSEMLIKKMANMGLQDDSFNSDLSIVSIGRLHEQKGFDLAIEACKMVIANGYNIKWFVIGEGDERFILEKMIEEYGLQNNFFLLGLRRNPYPYIKRASLYAQTSRYEGKSIAIDEAKMLHKPILSTSYTTIKDQIQHKENGFVTEMTSEAIGNGIIKLMSDQSLQEKLVQKLQTEKLGTEEEVYKLYKLF